MADLRPASPALALPRPSLSQQVPPEYDDHVNALQPAFCWQAAQHPEAEVDGTFATSAPAKSIPVSKSLHDGAGVGALVVGAGVGGNVVGDGVGRAVGAGVGEETNVADRTPGADFVAPFADFSQHVPLS